MNKNNEIQEIESIKSSLEYHFKMYNEYKSRSIQASRQKDRINATDDMFTHARCIELGLNKPIIFDIVKNGDPAQFGDFIKYVNSDFPKYLAKIESFLVSLRSEENVE